MDDDVDLSGLLSNFGWSASRAELVAVAGRAAFDRAVKAGRIVAVAQGRYALPESIGPARTAATRVNGIVSHESAALLWGMSVKERPVRPTVTVPRGRNLAPARRRACAVHWADVPASDQDDGATTPLRVVLDCAATLPFPEALVVADSALRRKLVNQDEMVARAAAVPKQVRARVQRVVESADPRPQSAFESLVRGYAADVPGLVLVPQVWVAGCHPDLYDERLRLAVECDSFEFHSRREDLVKDCVRYNGFALAEVTLVRFAWEHSMNGVDYVRSTLADAVRVQERALGLEGGS
jgi:hypothetical protein